MTPVRPETHARLGWRVAAGFHFARRITTVQLAAQEIRRVAQVMPVAFRSAAGHWQAVAVMGPVEGANVYVGRDGNWRASFVPARLRVYPFCLDAQGQLCLWDGVHAEHDGSDDVLPFYENGSLTPRLQQTQQFLRTVTASDMAVDRALGQFHAEGLLRPWTVAGADSVEGDRGLKDLFQVSETRLPALPDARLASCVRSGTLFWLHAHLDSLHHAERFTALATSLMHPDPAPPRRQDPIQRASDILLAIAEDLGDAEI